MNRTCIYCKAIYDDGLPMPKDCQGDFKDPKKNHGIGPCCTERANKEVDDWLKANKGRIQ